MTPERYIECPADYTGGGPSLFLAGGITGCPDWQTEIRTRLDGSVWTLLNPRRTLAAKDVDWTDPTEARRQIEWEYRHLRAADAVLFWFPRASVCPIALFELGAWSMTTKQLFVGVEPGYARSHDVEIQLELARPDVTVSSQLNDLAEAAVAHRIRT